MRQQTMPSLIQAVAWRLLVASSPYLSQGLLIGIYTFVSKFQ